MPTIEQWNQRYRSGERGGGPPAPLLIEAASGLPPGRALDLACGAGKNALWLAARGWEVVAVDAAEAAIDLLRSSNPAVDARVLDLEREALPFDEGSFDLVCIINFLHRPLFAEARRVLRPGGIAVAAIHTTRSAMNPAYALAPGELRSFFGGWDLIVDREDEVAEIAAMRPSSGANPSPRDL